MLKEETGEEAYRRVLTEHKKQITLKEILDLERELGNLEQAFSPINSRTNKIIWILLSQDKVTPEFKKELVRVSSALCEAWLRLGSLSNMSATIPTADVTVEER